MAALRPVRDLPAGDFDYDTHGGGYTRHRQPDPRIAAQVHAALGDSRSVINVGAGAGSYEPGDRCVVAVEPSATMRAQRPAHLVPALDATAESLPFDDDSFDAAMAMMTIHQWPDWRAGLSELRRVARGPVVIFTFDGEALQEFWLREYSPEILEAERGRFPAIVPDVLDAVGGGRVEVVSVPFDCTDGFGEAFYGRPEMFLDESVRRAQSGWGFVADADEQRAVDHLAADLRSGEWDRRFGHLRTAPTYEGSLRLVISSPSTAR